MKLPKKLIIGAAAFAVVVTPAAVYGASSQLSQQITAGVISTSIRNASGAAVSNPTFAMGAVPASTSQQTATGIFGDNTRRVTVDNPGGANNGWTLTWNATTPGTTRWTSGANNYQYNGTAAQGQLTVNPGAGSLTAVTGTATGVMLGSAAPFNGTTPVTLMSAAATSSDIWNGYVTGIGLSQTVPAGQALGTYTLDMTQTVTAT